MLISATVRSRPNLHRFMIGVQFDSELALWACLRVVVDNDVDHEERQALGGQSFATYWTDLVTGSHAAFSIADLGWHFTPCRRVTRRAARGRGAAAGPAAGASGAGGPPGRPGAR